jgi:hypothetical protein
MRAQGATTCSEIRLIRLVLAAALMTRAALAAAPRLHPLHLVG